MAKKIKPEPKPKKPEGFKRTEDGAFTRERAAPVGAVKGKAAKGAAKEKPISEAQETFGPTVQKSEADVGKSARITAEELATEIDRFAYENDTYEYKDTVDDRETNIRGIAESIESGQDGGARVYLNSFVQESDDAETVTEAKELLKKLDEYKPLAKVEELEEQNYNMIDNVINNLPQDPEEKKEPTSQREMRVAEVKKVRKRVSMKDKIAEKKAIIAQGDGAQEQDKKPPHREV